MPRLKCSTASRFRVRPEILKDYPHHLSGGMLQRVMIAIALINNPRLLIADEPTTALDVTIQAQILDLMNDLRESYDTSVIMITHDLGVIAETCEQVAVFYAGQVVEQTDVNTLFHAPAHPYTEGLLRLGDLAQRRTEGALYHPRHGADSRQFFFRLPLCRPLHPLHRTVPQEHSPAFRN